MWAVIEPFFSTFLKTEDPLWTCLSFTQSRGYLILLQVYPKVVFFSKELLLCLSFYFSVSFSDFQNCLFDCQAFLSVRLLICLSLCLFFFLVCLSILLSVSHFPYQSSASLLWTVCPFFFAIPFLLLLVKTCNLKVVKISEEYIVRENLESDLLVTT